MQTPRFRLLVMLVALPLAAAAAAQEDATSFARVSRDASGRAAALQTAIVTFGPADDGRTVTVDLIAAVHLGDRRYYQELNARFREYDALLFELVAPEGAAAAVRESGGTGLLSGAQSMLGNFLELSFQLDEIDYDATNFVHADLSPEELRASMVERNESLYVYFWRLYFAAIDDFSRDPAGVNDLAQLMSAGRGYDVKTAFALQLARVSSDSDMLAGESGSALIDARNERALEVLAREMAGGSQRVGIFYGAAHLPGMAQRLHDEFGFAARKTVWLDAWQLGD